MKTLPGTVRLDLQADAQRWADWNTDMGAWNERRGEPIHADNLKDLDYALAGGRVAEIRAALENMMDDLAFFQDNYETDVDTDDVIEDVRFWFDRVNYAGN